MQMVCCCSAAEHVLIFIILHFLSQPEFSFFFYYILKALLFVNPFWLLSLLDNDRLRLRHVSLFFVDSVPKVLQMLVVVLPN